MATQVDATELLRAQRRLRDTLLGCGSRIPWRPARDLAARMLLNLDDPLAGLQVAGEWLLEIVGADRVDAGFGTPRAPVYRPHIEVRRAGIDAPSILGTSMDARGTGIALVWNARHPVAFNDVAHDARLSDTLRESLFKSGTRRKLAVALRDGETSVGLLCADRVSHGGPWCSNECIHLGNVANWVIGPILAASLRLSARGADADSTDPQTCARLTPAEARVAQLVIDGYSYKEIARHLGRSLSTIDHQLRSIRAKLGVSSTAKLIRALHEMPRPT
jgi:DNA-binding CsgD family transcriptional regulator